MPVCADSAGMAATAIDPAYLPGITMILFVKCNASTAVSISCLVLQLCLVLPSLIFAMSLSPAHPWIDAMDQFDLGLLHSV